jgi:hypothetical protein
MEQKLNIAKANLKLASCMTPPAPLPSVASLTHLSHFPRFGSIRHLHFFPPAPPPLPPSPPVLYMHRSVRAAEDIARVLYRAAGYLRLAR